MVLCRAVYTGTLRLVKALVRGYKCRMVRSMICLLGEGLNISLNLWLGKHFAHIDFSTTQYWMLLRVCKLLPCLAPLRITMARAQALVSGLNKVGELQNVSVCAGGLCRPTFNSLRVNQNWLNSWWLNYSFWHMGKICLMRLWRKR